MIGTTAALIGSALIGAGTSAASAVIGGKAAGKAADAQAAVANENAAETRRQYDQTRADLEPWRQTGAAANRRIQDLINNPYMDPEFDKPFNTPAAFDESKVKFDPGFAQRLAASQKAIERLQARGGSFFSGATGAKLMRDAEERTSQEYGAAWNREYITSNDAWEKAMAEYQQEYNVFNQKRSDRYNRLASASGMGLTTTGMIGDAGANAVANMNASRGDAADARAAGIVGGANSTIGALSNIGNFAQQGLTLSMLLGLNKNTVNPIVSSVTPGYARNNNMVPAY